MYKKIFFNRDKKSQGIIGIDSNIKILSLFQFFRFFFYLFIFTAITWSCKKSTPFDSAQIRPDMLVKDFISTQYQDGNLSWELKASTSSYFYDENQSIANDITLNYFEDDKISAIVKAEKAVIHLDSNDIDLLGNVDMLSTSGNKLYTTKISWNNLEKIITTNRPVKIVKKNGDIIRGIGLRANYDLEDYEIKSNVKAITKNVNKKKNR